MAISANVHRASPVLTARQRSIRARVFLVRTTVSSSRVRRRIISCVCCSPGTCVNQVGSYSCLCPIGWTGHLCEVNINECSFPLSCHPNATCIDLPGSHQCVCPSWLTGSHCLTAIDQCETFPCLNHGVCVNNYGSLPTCHCQAGFTGVYCEVNSPRARARRTKNAD